MRFLLVPFLGVALLACEERSVMEGFELERETDTRMVVPGPGAADEVGTEGNSEQLDEQQDNPLDPVTPRSEEGNGIR